MNQQQKVQVSNFKIAPQQQRPDDEMTASTIEMHQRLAQSVARRVTAPDAGTSSDSSYSSAEKIVSSYKSHADDDESDHHGASSKKGRRADEANVRMLDEGESGGIAAADADRITEEQKKKLKRVLANRRSARESYKRRKKLFAELESSVDTLTRDNVILNRANAELRLEIMELRQQLGIALAVTNPTSPIMRANSLPASTLALSNHFQLNQLSGSRSSLSNPPRPRSTTPAPTVEELLELAYLTRRNSPPRGSGQASRFPHRRSHMG